MKRLCARSAVLALCFSAQLSQAVDRPLSGLISGLYGGDGIQIATSNFHQAHFTQQSGDALNQLNRRLGTDFGVFPFNSSGGSFSFAFDKDLGTFVNTTETLGPIFAERAPTVGRGKWSVSFYATFFNYNRFNGENLHGLHVKARHQTDEPGFHPGPPLPDGTIPMIPNDPSYPVVGHRDDFELGYS